MDLLSPTNLQILSQLVTVLLVLISFFAGMWARGVLEVGGSDLTAKQMAATCLVSFVIMGLPLTEMAHHSLSVPETTTLIVVLTACIPPFASGFTAREQIRKWLNGDAPAADSARAPTT